MVLMDEADDTINASQHLIWQTLKTPGAFTKVIERCAFIRDFRRDLRQIRR